jgi:hypothetical protein
LKQSAHETHEEHESLDMSWLDLQACRPAQLTEEQLYNTDNEEGHHVIWGEVESVSRGDSVHETSGTSSQTDQGSGSSARRKKIKNKRLQKPRGELARDFPNNIQFRQNPSDDCRSSPGSCSATERGAFSDGSNKGPDVITQCEVGNQQELVSQTYGEESHGSDDEHLPFQQVKQKPISPEEYEALKRVVRRNENGEYTSIGSAEHDAGCKPCLFVHSRVGCSNGLNCDFCHFTHKRRSRPRPCKNKRNRYRKLMERMEKEHDQEYVAHDDMVSASMTRNDVQSIDMMSTSPGYNLREEHAFSGSGSNIKSFQYPRSNPMTTRGTYHEGTSHCNFLVAPGPSGY